MNRKKITRGNTIRRSTRKWFPLFLGPVVCAFIIGFVWPFVQGIYLSFCQFKLIADAKPIGFGNYVRAFKDAAFALGVNRDIDPFMTLSFMSLPVIPTLRLTTRGVIDVAKQQYV